jgi:hypothetical protein
VITHLVVFRPKDSVGPAQRNLLVETLRTALQTIPSIRRVQFGQRVLVNRPYEQLMTTNYEFAALLAFDDLDGLRAYLDHPAHASLAAAFFTTVQDALMYDFDLRDGVEGLERVAVAAGARGPG